VADDVFGDKHADGVSRAGPANVADVVQDRTGDLSVGRVDDFQLDGDLACAPFISKRLCFLVVDLNGDGGQCAGVGGSRECESLEVGQD
jgi:hypothetical protein